MIRELTDAYVERRAEVIERLKAHPEMDYLDAKQLFTLVVQVLFDVEIGGWHRLDPERITVIDHGDYQGTQVLIVGAEGYQPSTYWYYMASYGSCSFCDHMRGINMGLDYDLDTPDDGPEYTENSVEAWANAMYNTGLNMVQGLKVMGNGE